MTGQILNFNQHEKFENASKRAKEKSKHKLMSLNLKEKSPKNKKIPTKEQIQNYTKNEMNNNFETNKEFE